MNRSPGLMKLQCKDGALDIPHHELTRMDPSCFEVTTRCSKSEIGYYLVHLVLLYLATTPLPSHRHQHGKSKRWCIMGKLLSRKHVSKTEYPPVLRVAAYQRREKPLVMIKVLTERKVVAVILRFEEVQKTFRKLLERT